MGLSDYWVGWFRGFGCTGFWGRLSEGAGFRVDSVEDQGRGWARTVSAIVKSISVVNFVTSVRELASSSHFISNQDGTSRMADQLQVNSMCANLYR